MNKLNKIIIGVLITVVGFLVCYNNNHYSMIGYVTLSDEQGVVICDEVGELWELEATDKYKVGDDVYIRWFDNNTASDRKDDEIVHVKVLEK